MFETDDEKVISKFKNQKDPFLLSERDLMKNIGFVEIKEITNHLGSIIGS